MKILITGATGFIGKSLCLELTAQGHDLVVLSRRKEKTKYIIPAPHVSIQWSGNAVETARSEAASIRDIDAVIHLAGESLSRERWNTRVKKDILESRVQGTQALLELLRLTGHPNLKVFISSSGIGIYGDCLDTVLTEQSPRGEGFLAEVCEGWENTLNSASLPGVRKVCMRTGVVLGKCGGALSEIIPKFTLGVAGILGNGSQWMSWIHLEDLVAMFMTALNNKEISGAINACAPEPVTNRDFTSHLSRSLHTPLMIPVPGSILRVVTGEVSTVLLSSQRAIPEKIKSFGFEFKYPNLEQALNNILGDSLSLGYEEFLDRLWVPCSVEKAFEFFSKAENLESITPPWLNFKIQKKSTEAIEKGTLIDYQLKIHQIPVKWRTEIQKWDPPHQFVDDQLWGPYRKWHHLHQFKEFCGGTLIEDHVHYRLPLGWLGRVVGGPMVSKDVSKIFAYRSEKIFNYLEA